MYIRIEYIVPCIVRRELYLSFLRLRVRNNESLFVNRTGGMSDAPRPKAVQLLTLPMTPRLLHDVERYVRLQRAVVLLWRQAAQRLQNTHGTPPFPFARFHSLSGRRGRGYCILSSNDSANVKDV